MPDSDYSFALEDDLFLEYHKFTNPNDYPEGYNKDIIKHLLPYQVKQFRYNLRQYQTLGDKAHDKKLTNTLRHDSKCKDLTPEKLAEHTFYQCVLSISKDQFPYINIMSGGESIRPTISGTFYSKQNREKAIQHIKKLCEGAKEIFVFDAYLDDRSAIAGLKRILPTSAKVVIPERLRNGDSSNVKSQLSGWTIEIRDMKTYSHHDRYLVVDNRLEIIVTSGFANLNETDKDITYIVRESPSKHLLR